MGRLSDLAFGLCIGAYGLRSLKPGVGASLSPDKAVIAQVPIQRFHFSGYATYRELASPIGILLELEPMPFGRSSR
jgi:hypothetical protein